MLSTKKLSIAYCPICDFIQHEVKQKINLHNQEDYQTVVDKKIINNPAKEIEFLKSDITTKNEITWKFINNDIRENRSCNMIVEAWYFDVTYETNDTQCTCGTGNSGDFVVKSIDLNTVKPEISIMNIDEQL